MSPVRFAMHTAMRVTNGRFSMLSRLAGSILAALLLAVVAVALVAAPFVSSPALAAAARDAGLKGEIALAQLPPEARTTLDLIRKGGPFPYRQDGTRFGNREKHLPRRGRDHYREYTVKTPGSRDRGARRIVAGAGGEYYYTEDHYNSFRRIKE